MAAKKEDTKTEAVAVEPKPAPKAPPTDPDKLKLGPLEAVPNTGGRKWREVTPPAKDEDK